MGAWVSSIAELAWLLLQLFVLVSALVYVVLFALVGIIAPPLAAGVFGYRRFRSWRENRSTFTLPTAS